MACNCGGKSGRVTWTHTKEDGSKKTYSSEEAARQAAVRYGGTVHRNG